MMDEKKSIWTCPVLMNLLLFIWSNLHWWLTGFELDLYCSKMMFKTEKRLKCSCFFLLSSFYNEQCVKNTYSIKVLPGIWTSSMHLSIKANLIWKPKGTFLIIYCPPYICLSVCQSVYKLFIFHLNFALLSKGGFKFIETKDHPIFQGEIGLNYWKFTGIFMRMPWNRQSI